MSNIFKKKWLLIQNAAMMHVAKRTPPGPDTVSISRTSFDDLIGVVAAAWKCNTPPIGVRSIHITCSNGLFTCMAGGAGIEATGEGSTPLEALSIALQDYDAKCDARLD